MAVLHCEDVIASAAAPPSDASVILDGVALPTGRALQANGSSGSDPQAKLFAKDGLFIRRGAAFDLIVPGCRPSQRMPSSSRWDLSDDWLVYPGGYFVTQAACVSLLVRRGRKSKPFKSASGHPVLGKAHRRRSPEATKHLSP
jgi:hypothetical protein